MALSVVIAGAAGLGTFAAVTAGGLSPMLRLSGARTNNVSVSQVVASNKISSLARLEPLGEIVFINAPGEWRAERITELYVRTGDHVTANQPLAQLECYKRLAAAQTEACAKVSVAQARLAQVRAGAKRIGKRAEINC